MPVLTIGIVRDCFYLLIFYSEKVAEKFAVNLNLSNVGNIYDLYKPTYLC